jgi:hypothetical protein
MLNLILWILKWRLIGNEHVPSLENFYIMESRDKGYPKWFVNCYKSSRINFSFDFLQNMLDNWQNMILC